MEVVYTSVLRDIIDIHERAIMHNRTIDHIKITKAEAKELNTQVFSHMDLEYMTQARLSGALGFVDGIKIIQGWK